MSTHRFRTAPRIALAPALTAALALAACSGDSTGGGHAGPPARLDIVSGDLQTGTVGAQLSQPLVVKVVDASGDPVPNQVVNFVVTAGGGSVFAGANQTNAQGIAQERWTLGTVAGDTQRVEVRAVDNTTGNAVVFATFRAVGHAAPGTRLVLQAPAQPYSPTAGSPLGDSVTVRVLDKYGNPAPGASVAWTVETGGGSVSPAASTSDAVGNARAQWTLALRVDSAQVLRAALDTSVVRLSLVAGLPPGTVIEKLAGDAQTLDPDVAAGQPMEVRVRTAGGTPIRGARVVFASTIGIVTPVPAVLVTDATGRAQSVPSSVTHQPGSYAVTASVDAGPQAVFTLTRQQGPPAAVVLPPGFSSAVTSAYAPFTAQARVNDKYGYGVPGVSVQWRMTDTLNPVSPAVSTTNASGVAFTTVSIAPENSVQGTRAVVPGVDSVTVAHEFAPYYDIIFTRPREGDRVYDRPSVEFYIRATSTAVWPGANFTGAVVQAQDRQCTTYVPGSDSSFRVCILDLTGLPNGPVEIWATAMAQDGRISRRRIHVNHQP